MSDCDPMSNSCPLSWWWYLSIVSFAIPFSFCLQSFPKYQSFLMSWLFASGGQSIAASTSVLPMNIQHWFPLGLIGLSHCSSTDSQESSAVPLMPIPHHLFNKHFLINGWMTKSMTILLQTCEDVIALACDFFLKINSISMSEPAGTWLLNSSKRGQYMMVGLASSLGD